MDIAVCIGRAVVKHEKRFSLVLFKNVFVNIFLVPLLKHDRLALGQSRPHGKIGRRQV